MHTILVMGRGSKWSRLFLEQLEKAKGTEHYQVIFEPEWPANEIPGYILIDLNGEEEVKARLTLNLLRKVHPDSAIVCFRESDDLEDTAPQLGIVCTYSVALRLAIGWPGYAIRHLEVARKAVSGINKN